MGEGERGPGLDVVISQPAAFSVHDLGDSVCEDLTSRNLIVKKERKWRVGGQVEEGEHSFSSGER